MECIQNSLLQPENKEKYKKNYYHKSTIED